jgi:hypothetical protein
MNKPDLDELEGIRKAANQAEWFAQGPLNEEESGRICGTPAQIVSDEDGDANWIADFYGTRDRDYVVALAAAAPWLIAEARKADRCKQALIDIYAAINDARLKTWRATAEAMNNGDVANEHDNALEGFDPAKERDRLLKFLDTVSAAVTDRSSDLDEFYDYIDAAVQACLAKSCKTAEGCGE